MAFLKKHLLAKEESGKSPSCLQEHTQREKGRKRGQLLQDRSPAPPSGSQPPPQPCTEQHEECER